ncbi:MAG TPA: NapC/NirT family cytochrome c [Anaeromyxobacteraceae bacterium]|nr:NapC/NirT family cytochrome c [Anaeromyxobacteraceae bacterium]
MSRVEEASRSPLAIAGAVIATVSGILILVLAMVGTFGYRGGPYLGILGYLVFPAFFVLGLACMLLGWRSARRRAARAVAAGQPPPGPPVIDFGKPRTRRLLIAGAAAAASSVVVLSVSGYTAVVFMDKPTFCVSCHKVTAPEYAAHQRSPHARVECVTCHIGSGASWFVKAKLSGVLEMVHYFAGTYPRPIPVPVENLRPARDTCEACHWPAKFEGDKLVVKTRYADDEASTPTKTVLLMHIGGGAGARGGGSHFHVAPGVRIRFLADPTLQQVSAVEVTRPDGTSATYLGSADTPDPGPGADWHVMDCIDCHNRPTHIFRSPEDALDLAIADGHIERGLPFLRREGVRLLKSEHPSHEAARTAIRAGLHEFYEKHDPATYPGRKPAVDRAAKELGDVWATNVWPDMKITWGTYPTFIGHDASAGCWRCHDGRTTRDGKAALSQECTLCHTLLAQDEKDPAIGDLAAKARPR